MRQPVTHLADASSNALGYLADWRKENQQAELLLLTEDILGKLQVAVVSSERLNPEVLERLYVGLTAPSVAGPFLNGPPLLISKDDKSDRALLEDLLRYSKPSQLDEAIRLVDRFRTRGGWLDHSGVSPWARSPGQNEGPPIVVFYSYKGGVGRSTALASAALQLARGQATGENETTNKGQRVFIIDGDLDAPGIASAFMPTAESRPRYGFLDYLLDSQTIPEPRLEEYVSVCRNPALVGNGEVIVLPAGNIDERYPARLARLSFEPEPGSAFARLRQLLLQIRDTYNPDWILYDARTGFTDMAAMALDGIGHCYVLCGTGSGQTWDGLGRVIENLGKDRLLSHQPQLDCFLLLTMLPRSGIMAEKLKQDYAEAALEHFESSYYADAESAEATGLTDELWTVDDAASDSASPHIPTAVMYDQQFAAYSDLTQIASPLIEDPGYRELARRLIDKFQSTISKSRKA